MPAHEKINYVELPAHDLSQVKAFFEQAFAWQFTDYGADYTAFANQGLDGGFYRSEKHSEVDKGAALIVFFSEDIAATEQKITSAGGRIVTPLFEFPGGQRFHFSDPCGNEYAVWAHPAKES